MFPFLPTSATAKGFVVVVWIFRRTKNRAKRVGVGIPILKSDGHATSQSDSTSNCISLYERRTTLAPAPVLTNIYDPWQNARITANRFSPAGVSEHEIRTTICARVNVRRYSECMSCWTGSWLLQRAHCRFMC